MSYCTFKYSTTIENTTKPSPSETRNAGAKAKPVALKVSRHSRKHMPMGSIKLKTKMPDLKEITLDEFMAAREILEAQKKVGLSQGEKPKGSKASKPDQRRHASTVSSKSELLGDQGYRSVATAAITRARRMITSGPQNLSSTKSQPHLETPNSAKHIHPYTHDDKSSSVPKVSTASIDKRGTKVTDAGVPTFIWPKVVAVVPDHHQPSRPLTSASASKANQIVHATSQPKDHGNSHPKLPIVTSNINAISLPPFLVLARHGQKYAIGQATLPSLASLGLTPKRLAPTIEAPRNGSILPRPLPADNPNEISNTSSYDDAIAGQGCITHVSFGPMHNLPTIIINHDMSRAAQPGAQKQPGRIGMKTTARTLRI